MTTSRNEPDTFRFVAQCLNQLRLLVLEEQHHLIFCTNVFNQLCQPSEVLQLNTNHYDSYCQVIFNTAIVKLVSTAYSWSGTGSDASICFGFTQKVKT
jgi:hypothetical protein